METERREDEREEVLGLATLTVNFEKVDMLIVWMSKLLCAGKTQTSCKTIKQKTAKEERQREEEQER